MKTLSYKTPWGTVIDNIFIDTIEGLTLGRIDEDGNIEPWGYAEAKLPDHHLLINEVAIRNHSENQGILDALVEAGIVKAPHRYVVSGYVRYPICILNAEVAKEYQMEDFL
jgi:hypothetical protein